MTPLSLNLNSRWLAVRRGVGALVPWLLGRLVWLLLAGWAFDVERRWVRRQLSEAVREVVEFLRTERTFFNSEADEWDRGVLEWDFHVRALFRRYLGPDHLEKYVASIALGEAEARNIENSSQAFERAKEQIEVTINAIQRRSGIVTGGLLHGWLGRTIVNALVLAVITSSVFFNLIELIPGVAEEVPTTAGTNPKSNAVQDIVTDEGDAVEVAPTATLGPGTTPTVPSTPPIVSLPAEPPLDIPPEPEQHEPASAAGQHFSAGVEALEQQDFAIAVKEFEAAVGIEPGFVRAYYNLGLAYEGRDMPDDMRAAVESYTAAIDLWNSLGVDGDGLLFQAKLGRGLLLVSFASERGDVCLGRLDLLDVLERGDPSPRNEEAINIALAQIEINCETPGEMTTE